MEKTKRYEEAQAFTGDFEVLSLGGKTCRIISAKEEKSKNGNDMLSVEFDIDEGENEDYYKRRFEESTKADKKWSGVHRTMLYDNKGNTNKFFKGFIASIEESNKGFKWDWKEAELKGKLFGGVFGREQYENSNGELKMTTKLRQVRSIEKIKDAEIPEDKLLKGSTVKKAAEEYKSDLPF